MVKKISLLLYEKEKKLNLILEEQIFKTGLYDIHSIIDETRLTKSLELLKPNILILNFNDLNRVSKNTIQNFKIKNNNVKIIGYCNSAPSFLEIDYSNIKILYKPFKIISLLGELIKLGNSKFLLEKDVLLSDCLKFIPNKRILYNLKTQNKEYLTEKENQLLSYFYLHINVEISRNELLNQLWGFSENIITHTLETHIYRLKLKFNRLEPNLSFPLTNNRGVYTMIFNTKNY